MKKLLIGGVCMILMNGICAQNMPHQSGKDPRVQVVNFKAHDVIPISVPIFTSLHVALDASEVIESIQSGDSQAWNIYQHKRYLNQFFIKPLAPGSITNLTVLTEKNVYYFTLNVKESHDPSKDLLGLEVKLPNTAKKLAKPAALYCVSNRGNMNLHYAYHGQKPSLPRKVCDDGSNTYFIFDKHQSIPAIFKVIDRHGHESMVNFRSEGQTLIVREVHKQWTLREGNNAVSIFNENMRRGVRRG